MRITAQISTSPQEKVKVLIKNQQAAAVLCTEIEKCKPIKSVKGFAAKQQAAADLCTEIKKCKPIKYLGGEDFCPDTVVFF